MSREPTVEEFIELTKVREQLRMIYQLCAVDGFTQPSTALFHGRQARAAVSKIRAILDSESTMSLSTAAAMHQIANVVASLEKADFNFGPLSDRQLDNLIVLDQHR